MSSYPRVSKSMQKKLNSILTSCHFIGRLTEGSPNVENSRNSLLRLFGEAGLRNYLREVANEGWKVGPIGIGRKIPILSRGIDGEVDVSAYWLRMGYIHARCKQGEEGIKYGLHDSAWSFGADGGGVA